VSAARWIQRTLIGLAAIAATGLLTGATYERAMRIRARGEFTAPGRLVDVGGGRRIQIDCRGTGSPTVVLESGLDNFGSLAWAAVHDSIAATTRVCAYSRAGLMWSDPSDAPFDSKTVARDLHAALAAAGESAPWVMVGHSLGGPYVMAFTNLYDAEVAGVVFVDASHPDQFARFQEATGKPMMPTPGVVRVGAALAWSGIVRLLPSAAPAASWPRDVDRMTHAFLPLSVNALAHEVEAIPATLVTAGASRQLGDRPLVVLSAGRAKDVEELRAMGLTPAQGARLQAASLALHDDEAKWSRRGRHEIVSDATHYIQFDRPDVVIRAVREVVAASVAK
jgi:pimeloyl-ACP methyl ester carboxylesterase